MSTFEFNHASMTVKQAAMVIPLPTLSALQTYGSTNNSFFAKERLDAARESSATTAILSCLAYNRSIASAGVTSKTFISMLGKIFENNCRNR